MRTIALAFVFVFAATPPEKERTRATPNLDKLAAQSQTLKKVATYEVTEPSGHQAFLLDYTLEIRPESSEQRYVFMMPTGDLYDLKIEVEGNGTRSVLQLPDRSTITLRYTESSKKATIIYGKKSVPVDLDASKSSQFGADPVASLRLSLPDSGRALVAMIQHVRGDMCREASLCGSGADRVLDLFRTGGELEDDVGPETANEKGWTVKTLSAAHTMEPQAR